METLVDDRPTLAQYAQDANGGMVCKCGSTHLPAIRTSRIGRETVRIRKCRVCGREYQSRERIIAEVDKRKTVPPSTS